MTLATTTRPGNRDRVSFATIEEVLPVPDLLHVQKDSFDWFVSEGLAETLREISPIEDYSGNLILEFVDHEFEDPKHSIEECRERDIQFGCPLFVTARFGNRETGEIKEQRVFMGEFPLMTPSGTFVINGTEKVVVSQLVRSPGIYFEELRDKTSEKLLFGAKVIPARGAWLEFDTDKKGTLGVRIDRKRRQVVTILLRALEFAGVDLTTDEAILDYFDGAEIIAASLEKDPTNDRDEALIDIYRKLRPGEPPSVESARGLLEQLFFSSKRYDLSRVGRYKANQKFEILDHDVPLSEHVLTPEDVLDTVKYMVALHAGEDGYTTDDIDHFGNRRVRPVGELIQNQVRIGLSRMERVVRERMTTQDVEAITPTTLINIRPLTAAIKEFYGTSQLCQLYDQTNSLTGLTHKRRLSALGPGGLSRERAGFEVRDVHPSHYGRMCPIETPEGPNIGLIGSLATYARINNYGFIETPYRKVVKGRVTEQIDYLDAHREDRYTIAQANAEIDKRTGNFVNDRVLCMRRGEVEYTLAEEVDYMDVAPRQIVSVSTSCIPFLEHDDANRALMGSNMQRQAVPLLRVEAPYIGTGMEERAARDSLDMVVADEAGTVTEVAGDRVVVEDAKTRAKKTYRLQKFRRSNQSTSFNQRPVVTEGQKIKAGDIIADGPCTDEGELALGKNLLVAFMTWEGHTFEDAIVISDRLVRDDVLTSIHIEQYEVEARDTKLGEEEITRDIPNVSEEVLRDLDERGIIRVGAEVGPGDYLVGKVTPKGETELTPEERLLRAIFGEKAREVRDTSLKVPHGEWGKVIDVRAYSREDNAELNPGVNKLVRVFVAQKRKISVGDKLAGRHGNKGVIAKVLPVEDMPFLSDGTPVDIVLSPLGVPTRMNVGQVLETLLGWAAHNGWEDGPTQPGNGARRKIQPVSRPAAYMSTPVFDGAHWSDEEAEEAGANPATGQPHPSIQSLLRKANPPLTADSRLIGDDGKAQLYDGRTGEPYDHPIAIGYIYILKLHHLVDDKIHERSTGPYSMITQQPLGGKAQFGGQRFGEMEVWALEAYGAAHALQELLTIKSDDVLGRVKVYEAIVKGENIPEPGLPESFKVLVKEMQSLCLNVKVKSKDGQEIEMTSYEEDAFRTAEELGIDISRPERSEAEEA
ncbi:MAG: DNA-directed RNA polymerase subunit beta [Acidimicrobiia bacterium]|nr:DNA-directed RNA polymerase subunit beta [Acidimicrobiia bacterium]